MESSDLTSGPSEIGSLTAHSNEDSQFVGSSSGVFFINTVRRAFSNNLNSSTGSFSVQEFPPPEDTIVGSEDSRRDRHYASPSVTASPSVSGGRQSACRWKYHTEVAAILGNAPPLDPARELMIVYFKVWHPLFPFLHGPTFLQAMELFYSESNHTNPHVNSLSQDYRNACWTTIFQCVFNLASHLRPDLRLPPQSRIKSPSSMHSLLGTLTRSHDIPSLQALLAAQLYLAAKMSLHTASTVGGCILRSMLHAGLHRCPFRYRELSSHDRQLRKRIFWCAYAIDRYLSQALGLPLGIQDSDIDVCPPGAQEAHAPGSYRPRDSNHAVSSVFLSKESPMVDTSTPNDDSTSMQAESPNGSPNAHPNPHITNEGPAPLQQQYQREIAFASYVESGKLTGRALELFHKSILVRSIQRSSVLFLVTDVHKWWNSLSIELQGSPAKLSTPLSVDKDAPFNFGPFFTVLYHHLILLINRPSLSLSPSSPEFCSGLQTCIGAARGILTALKAQVDGGQALFWPGFLSAAWMSGLVLAFACQLRQYVLSKGSQEITECLDILHKMSVQWETAKDCHRALSLLSHNIGQSFNPSFSTIQSSSTTRTPAVAQGTPPSRPNEDPNASNSTQNKKRKLSSTQQPNANIPPSRPSSIPITTTTDIENRETMSFTPDISLNYNNSTGITTPLPSNQQDQDISRLLFSEDYSSGINSLVDFDSNLVDLLQGANFDNLLDMFGQQYPSF